MDLICFDSFSPPQFLQGRGIANSFLLRSLARYSQAVDSFYFFLGSLNEKNAFFSSHPFLNKDNASIYLREAFLSFELDNGIIFQPDIELFHIMAMRQLLHRREPIIGLTHTISYPRLLEQLQRAIPSLRGNDRIICTSDTAKKVLMKLGIPEEILPVIPLGCPIEENTARYLRNREKLRQELRLDDKVVFLHFSRICEHSKADLMPLLKVVYRLSKRRRDFRVIIAGSSDESNYAELLSKIASVWGISDLVSIVTNPREEDKFILFSIADVFICLSDNFQETFGQVILEAMAFGLPIIATDWGGFRDTLEDVKSKWLIPSFTLEGIEDDMAVFEHLSFESNLHLLWAETICLDLNFLESVMIEAIDKGKNLRRMGEENISIVENKYKWEKVISQYDKLFESVPETGEERESHSKPDFNKFSSYGRIFYEIYPSGKLSNSQLLSLGDAELIEKGWGIYETISPVIDLDRIHGLANKIGGEKITVETALTYVSKQELLWMIKQGWLKLS